jgi:hypothetical protein
MLRKFENLACFGPTISALLIEGAFVYWMWVSPITTCGSRFLAYGNPWVGPTLPQCWLLGGVAALFYYLCHARQSDAANAVEGRRAFLRIWCWFHDIASVQGCALCLNHFALVHR